MEKIVPKPQEIWEKLDKFGPLGYKFMQMAIPFIKLDPKASIESCDLIKYFDKARTNIPITNPEDIKKASHENPLVASSQLQVDFSTTVGSASVAVIHPVSHADLPNKSLVIKIIRPDQEEKYKDSAEKIRLLVGLFFKEKDPEVTEVISDLIHLSFSSDFDCYQEIKNISYLKQIGLRTPQVFENLSSQKTIVMENLKETIPLSNFPKDSPLKKRRQIIGRYLASLIKMLRKKTIHGDPHAGNVLVDKNNYLYWIDPNPMFKLGFKEIITIFQTLSAISFKGKVSKMTSKEISTSQGKIGKNNRSLISYLNKLAGQTLSKKQVDNLNLETENLYGLDFWKKIIDNKLLPETKYLLFARSLIIATGTTAEFLPEYKNKRDWLKLILSSFLRSFSRL